MGYLQLIQAGSYYIYPFIALSLGVPDIYLNQSYDSNSSKLDRSKGKTTLSKPGRRILWKYQMAWIEESFRSMLLSNSSIVQ